VDAPPHVLRILDRLKGVERTGDQWRARCPAHDDQNPSLSIKLGDDGKVLVRCHAGCEFPAIAKAMGLAPRDFFAPNANSNGHAPQSRTAPRRGRSSRTFQKWTAAADWICHCNGWRLVASWAYKDAQGDSVLRICRFEPLTPPANGAKPDKQFRPISRVGNGFVIKDPPGLLPLFRLPELIASATAPVYLSEGEKKSEALADLGLVATATAHGSKSPQKTDLAPLAGRDVRILPDNDAPGRSYATKVGHLLLRLTPPTTVRIVELPDLPEHGDAVEFIADRRAKGKSDAEIRAEIEALVSAAKPIHDDAVAADDDSEAEGDDEDGFGRPSQTERLLYIACERAELFHDRQMNAFISFEHHGAFQTYPVERAAVRHWLGGIAYRELKKRVGRHVLEAVQEHLAAIALHESDRCIEVHHRLARDGDKLYYALHDESWRVVEIARDGWRVASGRDLPVRFTRDRLTLPQVCPESGENIDAIFNFVNLVGPRDRLLLKAFLVSPFLGDLPRPLLEFAGEAGSGKSSAARYVIDLLDPHVGALRTLPRDERDLFAASQNRLVIAFDNRSHLTADQADALCMFATGGAHAARKLFTDGETHALEVRASAILTSITSLVTRSDLASRTISLTVPRIDDADRREEADLKAAWVGERPRIFGALFSAIAVGLRDNAGIHLARKSRLADFERWACACSTALGFDAASLSDALNGARSAAAHEVVEASAVGRGMLTLTEEQPWLCTAASDASTQLRELGVELRLLPRGHNLVRRAVEAARSSERQS